MVKRVLMIATVPSMIGQFNVQNIKLLLEMGYQVDVAANFDDVSIWPKERIKRFQDEMASYNIECINIDFSRNYLNIAIHFKSYKQILNLLKERKYSFIHTHTPIASALVRLAAKKTLTKVIYTAHGFHFYKGAPLLNWLIFYPLEKRLSKYTDVLITINKEDYNLAMSKFRAKSTMYIPGVGVDVSKFSHSDFGRNIIRKELKVKSNEIMALSVGELNHNKNHVSVIKAIKGLNITYVVVGRGNNEELLKKEAEKNGVKLILTGYRDDVSYFYDAADIYVLPSIREGLNVSLMEAMASGLPVCCSAIRGNLDLIEDKRAIFEPLNLEQIKKAIVTVVDNRTEFGIKNLNKIRQFDISLVNEAINKIYGGGGLNICCKFFCGKTKERKFVSLLMVDCSYLWANLVLGKITKL